jgi:hypothetical protein
LQLQQQSGDELESVTGNGGQGEKIPKTEAHLVHARIWVPDFNPQTGEDRAIRRVQSFDKKDYEKMKNEQAFAGYKVEILHDGGEPVEGAEVTDYLTPQIVSQPGAGIDLTKDYSKANDKELQEAYKSFYPDEKNPPKKKGDILEAIQSRVGFIKDEQHRQELEQQEQNRKAAAGVPIDEQNKD